MYKKTGTVFTEKNYEKKLTKEDVKIDLKHDSIEFAASTDRDDTPDTDDAAYEEAGIIAEELDAMEDDDENEAAALNATETYLQADEKISPGEDCTDDLPKCFRNALIN